MEKARVCPTLLQLIYTIKCEETSLGITICTNNDTFPKEYRYDKINMYEFFIRLRNENENQPLFDRLVDRFVLRYPKEDEDLRYSGVVSFEIFLV